jgi:hypothetical protein
MSKTFQAKTPFGLVLSTLTDIAGTVHFDDIVIDSNLAFTITIDDPYFKDPTIVDYRISQLITAIQEDFLGIYNQISGEKITLDSLRYHPELVIKATLRKGSLIAEVTNAIRAFDSFMKNFAPEQKMKALKLALGIFALGCGTHLATNLGGKYIDYLSVVKVEDTKFAIRQLELAAQKSPIVKEAINAAKNNSKTPNAIAGIISDTGTFKIGAAPKVSGQELRFKIQQNKIEEQAIESMPFKLDGAYKIDCQNYDKQTIQIKINKRIVWASTAGLHPDDREELKRITDAAVDQKKAQRRSYKFLLKLLTVKFLTLKSKELVSNVQIQNLSMKH